MRLGKTVVTFKPERAFGGSSAESEEHDVVRDTTRRSSARPTRRYGEAQDDTDPRWVRAGDTLPASMIFEDNDEEPDTIVVDTPIERPRIPTPRQRVLTPAPALFEDSGLFRL